MRHRDAAGVDPYVALIALGDALPPAATAVFEDWAPVSTITWDVHVCRDDLVDGSSLARLTEFILSLGRAAPDAETLWRRPS